MHKSRSPGNSSSLPLHNEGSNRTVKWNVWASMKIAGFVARKAKTNGRPRWAGTTSCVLFEVQRWTWPFLSSFGNAISTSRIHAAFNNRAYELIWRAVSRGEAPLASPVGVLLGSTGVGKRPGWDPGCMCGLGPTASHKGKSVSDSETG